MTVSTTTSSVSYSATGSQTTFPYTFRIFEDSDLLVILKNVSTSAETVQNLGIGSDYTVTGAGDELGGNVVFNVAPSAGNIVSIQRNIPITQTTDYVENDPFPAESHEAALDKLTMIAQKLDSDNQRAILFPELSPASGGINELPTVENRANKVMGFTSTGAATVTSSTIAQIDATVSSFVNNPANNASNVLYDPEDASAVQTNVQAKLREVVSVKDFGAVGDGSTDDSSAFEDAFASLGEYSKLLIPEGHYIINTDNMSVNYFEITNSNVQIAGAGASATFIEMTGTSNKGFIYSNDKNYISVSGIHWKGNEQATGFNEESTFAFFNYTDTTAGSDDGHIRVFDCIVEGSAGPYWVGVYNYRTATTYPVRDVQYSNITCFGGDDRDETSLAVAARQIGAHSVTGGLIESVTVSDCHCDAFSVKMGIAFQGEIDKVAVSNCIVRRTGQEDSIDDTGRYGMMFYLNVTDISVTGCVITDPYDAGIYAVGDDYMNVSGCVFTGHEGTTDTTLLKGAIAASDFTTNIVGNLFRGNAINVSHSCGRAGKTANVSGNYFDEGQVKFKGPISSSTASAHGGVFSGNHCKDVRITMTGDAGGSPYFWDNFAIMGNTFENVGTLSSFITSDSIQGFRQVMIKDNTFRVSGTLTMAIDGEGGPDLGDGLQIRDNFFEGSPSNYMIGINQADNGFVFANNHFKSVTPAGSNYILKLQNCQGQSYGNTFEDCDLTKLIENTGSPDMGIERPTWTGEAGHVVQLFNENLRGHYIYSTDSADWSLGGGDVGIFDEGDSGSTTKEIEIEIPSQAGVYSFALRANVSPSYFSIFTGYLSISVDFDGTDTIHDIELDEQFKTSPSNTTFFASFDVNFDVKTATLAYSGSYAKTKSINVQTNGYVSHIKFQIGTAGSGREMSDVQIGLRRIEGPISHVL